MIDPQRYLAIYLAPLPPGPRASRQLEHPPALDPRHCYPPGSDASSRYMSLPQLFTAAVECGHAEARAELKRRVAIVETDMVGFRALQDREHDDRRHLAAELAQAQHDLLARQLHVASLEEFVDEARARIEAKHRSAMRSVAATTRPFCTPASASRSCASPSGGCRRTSRTC